MLASDLIRLTARAIGAHPLRSFLTLLGIAVGVTAVILLTAIGEGVHRFVLQEFTQFGTNVMQIAPGKIAARGGPPGLPTTARPLTIEDSQALRRIPGVVAVTPLAAGNAEVEANGRLRRTAVYGVGAEMPAAYSARVRSGRFLPAADDALQPRPLAVLGAKLKHELFGSANALGARLRIAGERFRVIGVMAPKGQFLGTDLDDSVFIPAARALAMTNREGLQEINLAYAEGLSAGRLVAAVRALLRARHGREDFTVITQEDMLRSLSRILDVLTAAVGALGGISLVVGGVGIVTIMTIAVAERTGEIALLVALGARRATILSMFLAEAVLLSLLGGLFGLILGTGLAALAGLLLPGLPVALPWRFVLVAEALAGLIGLAAGVLPARRAARLDPIEALRAE
ncbi:MAG: ABC transporter permease [Rhodocyclaceae bacterium]|nr:ABC transporter permease [Rhodocyclaceae bacterium]